MYWVKPKSDSLTVSGMVLRSVPSLSYTVIVCRYIMFWAKTRPRPEATTDLGEMSPVIFWPRLSVRSGVGGPGGGGGGPARVVSTAVGCAAAPSPPSLDELVPQETSKMAATSATATTTARRRRDPGTDAGPTGLTGWWPRR